jgi:hypothetical protein
MKKMNKKMKMMKMKVDPTANNLKVSSVPPTPTPP